MNPHAELIKQYAKDWTLSQRPWENWEFFNPTTQKWIESKDHPTWAVNTKYRRKPNKTTLNLTGLTKIGEYRVDVIINKGRELAAYSFFLNDQVDADNLMNQLDAIQN